MFKIRHKTKVLIEVTLLFALKLGMMEAFGTNEKDKEVCVVYQDDDQKVKINYHRKDVKHGIFTHVC